MIKVEIKCSGYGASTWETVMLTRDEIERAAIAKLREINASPTMQVIDMIMVLNDHLYGRGERRGILKKRIAALVRLWCFLRGHDWVSVQMDTGRSILVHHECARCNAHKDMQYDYDV